MSPPPFVIKRKDQEIQSFLHELGAILCDELYCDLSLKCYDGEVRCPSALLSTVSPFLRYLISHVPLPDVEQYTVILVPDLTAAEVQTFFSALLAQDSVTGAQHYFSEQFKAVSEVFSTFCPLRPQSDEPLDAKREEPKKTGYGVLPAENYCQVSIKAETFEQQELVNVVVEDSKNVDNTTEEEETIFYDNMDENVDVLSDYDDNDNGDVSSDEDFKPDEDSIIPNGDGGPTINGNTHYIGKRRPGRPKKSEMREKTVDDEAYIENIVGTDGRNLFKCKECGATFERKWSMTMHIRIHTKERPYMCEFPDCGASFARPQNLWRHNKTHTQEKPHICPICLKGFCERKDMLTHIIIHDESRKTQNRFLPQDMMKLLETETTFEFDGREVRTDSICDVCGKIFELPTMKRRHVSQVHEGMKPYSCECGRSFTSKAGLERHSTDHTGEFPFLCPECPKKFKSSTELKQHSVRHMDPDEVGENRKCPHEGCAKIFEKKFYLDIHIRRHHTHEKPFTCDHDDCDKSFTVKAALKDHERVHTGEKPYNCDICGKDFSTSGALRIHKMIHEEQRRYTCEVEDCGKTFRINKNLWRHKKVDHGILAEKGDGRIVECSDCGKRCSDKHALEKHQIKHTTDKNYVCTICGKRLKRQNSLDLHMRQHGGVKNYMCDQCDATYFTASALRNHKVNKHMEIKETFLCTFCGKGFSKKANLDSHITLHTGEKRYNCSQCDKKFRSHSVFQNHLRYHRGKKEFVCSYCGKAFMQKSHLQRHTATHTGERKHGCPVCSKTFIEPGDVRKHMRTHSKETITYQAAQHEQTPVVTVEHGAVNHAAETGDVKPTMAQLTGWGVEHHHLATHSPPHLLAAPQAQALAAAAMLEHAHRTFQI